MRRGHSRSTSPSSLPLCAGESRYSAYSPLEGLNGGDVFNIPQVIAIGKAHNVSGAQVALRWLVQQNITAVTAAHNPAYIAEDIDVFSFELTPTEMDTLSKI